MPTPLNMSYFWSNGSILGMMYVFQVMTGVLLACLYTTGDPFASVDYMMRDVFGGWAMRYFHVTGASLLFVFLFVHMGRGMYYQSSYSLVLTWVMGMVVFLLFMMSSFLGYVLPWGQMSFWGAAVMTKFLSVMPFAGDIIVQWVWGGFGVGDSTLVRFFSFHVIFPLLGAPGMLAHILSLHSTGSSNPLGVPGKWVSFGWLFLYKDMVGFLFLALLFVTGLSLFPNLTADAANFMEADPLVTPTHMKPEWYFLAAYAVLRSVPSKVGGVIAMMMFMAVHLLVPFLYKARKNWAVIWSLLVMFLILTWLGGVPAEEPYVSMAQYMAMLYFFTCFTIL